MKSKYGIFIGAVAIVFLMVITVTGQPVPPDEIENYDNDEAAGIFRTSITVFCSWKSIAGWIPMNFATVICEDLDTGIPRADICGFFGVAVFYGLPKGHDYRLSFLNPDFDGVTDDVYNLQGPSTADLMWDPWLSNINIVPPNSSPSNKILPDNIAKVPATGITIQQL